MAAAPSVHYLDIKSWIRSVQLYFFYSMFARGLLHADDGYPRPKRENMYDFRLFALWFECQMAPTCMVQDVRSLRGWGLSVCVGG